MNQTGLYESLKVIFVVGTGRSGTTVLARLLGEHPCISVAPTETRIITDPDGLLALKRAFVDDWSPWNVDVAITRFKRLMSSFAQSYLGAYPGYSIDKLFGPDKVGSIVTEFLDKLCEFRFRGAWVGQTNILEKGFLRFVPGWRQSSPLMNKIIITAH
jgi:hypothetical protein